METQTITSTDSGDFELFESSSPVDSGANEGSERAPANESASTDNDTTKQTTVKDGLENNNNRTNNATTSKAEVDPNKQPEKPKFVSRGEKREQAIREGLAEQKKLAEENRQLLQKIEAAQRGQVNPQAATQAQQQTQTQEPVFVEKPQAPQYTKEQLQTMAQRAQAEGNQEGMQAIRDELAKWDKYDIDLKFWKLENGKKIESFQQAWTDNWKKAVSKFPELSNKESPIYKEADLLARQFPEVLNRAKGDGQYLIAQLAGMRLERKNHASEVAALKDQVTKLTDQLNATQKKIQPTAQSSKPNISASNEVTSAEDRLSKRLGIRG